jgi:hypothetical protein
MVERCAAYGYRSSGYFLRIPPVRNVSKSGKSNRDRVILLFIWAIAAVSTLLLYRSGARFNSHIGRIGIGSALGGAAGNLLVRHMATPLHSRLHRLAAVAGVQPGRYSDYGRYRFEFVAGKSLRARKCDLCFFICVVFLSIAIRRCSIWGWWPEWRREISQRTPPGWIHSGRYQGHFSSLKFSNDYRFV